MDALSDEELMCRYRDGDTSAFATLFARHKPGVLSYLRRQCRNAAIAEELYQDVWTTLINARERYTASAKFITYLYTIARSRLIDHVRRQRGFVVVAGDSNSDETGDAIVEAPDTRAPDPVAALHAERCVEQLRVELDHLPDEQREAFVLHEEGVNLEGISDVTQTPLETVKSRIRYALAKLRKKLEDCL